MLGTEINFPLAALVCLFSMTVVFLVLLAISCLIDLIGKLPRRRHAPDPQQKHAEEETPPAPDGTQAILAAAAIAAFLGKRSDEIVVRSIRRVPAAGSVWEQAGRMEAQSEQDTYEVN